jgi:hypothetical protein
MKTRLELISSVIGLLLLCILVGCSALSPAPPTPTPEPTRPQYPHGTFIGCIYYQGEVVKGFINYYDMDDNFVKNMDSGKPDCNSVMLSPGSYYVVAEYWGAGDCHDKGCFPEEEYEIIDIEDGETIQMDIEVYQHE